MNKTSKKIPYKGILSAIALLLVAVLASVSALFAWFYEQKRVRLGGMNLAVTGTNVELGDILLTRKLGDRVGISSYARDGNAYYASMNGVIVTDEEGNRQPFALDAVTGGEELTVAVQVKAQGGFQSYRVYLGGLAGDTLTQADGETARNVMGAFQYYNKETGEWAWFLEYRDDAAEVVPGQITVLTGSFAELQADENGYMSVEFLLRVDYSQLESHGVDLALLVGKGLKIGTLAIVAVQNSPEN